MEVSVGDSEGIVVGWVSVAGRRERAGEKLRQIEKERECVKIEFVHVILSPPSCNTTASNDARPVSVTTVTTYSRPVCGEGQRSINCSEQVVCVWP